MAKSLRVFWFGAHKVLKKTELKQLRDMGYEVFNPAYISPVYDQSMDRRIDSDQFTTLPETVFADLLEHDFFYTQVPEPISELLNEYFDVIVVTINPDWLISVLKAFRGQIVWRIYGQPYLMSDYIVASGQWRRLIEQERFTIVPFAAESIEREHRWFLDLCTEIVPYQIPDDVFALSNTWSEHPRRYEIATSIPNIANPYYAEVYNRFNAQYPHRVFRIFGPQRSSPPDSRIVGTLDRAELLDRFAASSGYLYNYTDEVCYLPPIEAMEIGTPVLYANGSLLSRFYGGPSPGLIEDGQDAEIKIARLLNGDRGFASELVAAQDKVRSRYDRAVVIPLFEAAFKRLLSTERLPVPKLTLDYPTLSLSRPAAATQAPAVAVGRKSICILLHVDGLFEHRHGRVYAFEGIPRVVDVIVDVLVKFSDYHIMVTCTEQSAPIMYDFFHDYLINERLSLRVIRCSGQDGPAGNLSKLWFVEDVNGDSSVAAVLVPHYYLFPEALALTIPTILYLPDYFPHIMPGTVFDTSVEKDAENKEVGIAIAAKSAAILTNSEYTKRYLVDAGFVTDLSLSKVVVSPLPLLGAGRTGIAPSQDEAALQAVGTAGRFLFYPTANRPNKQLAFLLKVFARLRLSHPDLRLVLTGNLDAVPGVREIAERYDLIDHIVVMQRVGESTLKYLYENAAMLCLTSTIEGNFPPQVLEALAYGTPLVATRLTTMTDVLQEHAKNLLLCSPLDIDAFCERAEEALLRPKDILARQAKVVAFLQTQSTQERFFSGLTAVIGRCLKPCHGVH